MADPADRFFEGIGLGLRAKQVQNQTQQIQNQNEQFRTNLSERARQANRQFDLNEQRYNLDLSRNNAYVSRLKFEMDEIDKENNMTAVRREQLSEWKTRADQAAATRKDIPLPPAGLGGEEGELARAHHSALENQRKESEWYKVNQAWEKKELELVPVYGLHPNWKNLGEEGTQLYRAASSKRLKTQFNRITSKFGVTGETKRPISSSLVLPNGMLDEELLTNRLNSIQQVLRPKNKSKQERKDLAMKIITSLDVDVNDPEAREDARTMLDVIDRWADQFPDSSTSQDSKTPYPSVGDTRLVDGVRYRFKGGDPNRVDENGNPVNWEEADEDPTSIGTGTASAAYAK